MRSVETLTPKQCISNLLREATGLGQAQRTMRDAKPANGMTKAVKALGSGIAQFVAPGIIESFKLKQVDLDAFAFGMADTMGLILIATVVAITKDHSSWSMAGIAGTSAKIGFNGLFYTFIDVTKKK